VNYTGGAKWAYGEYDTDNAPENCTASGPFPPIDALQLAIRGSLFFTRPALADYIADPLERAELSGELFDHVIKGRIKIEVNQRYELKDCVQAHKDLEAGRTTGSSIFVI